ncbi:MULTISPECIES: MerR family transcriptional regulator [unclassified Sedimentibacter]|uniref:MerR family transcriptional regulator n=1 Tax=unclassified Sedimentibacter TaxID=2649220 RepID=UPI0027E195B5|nr:helix-turn-helix domain-containing protein [Sedimentibacter sp. MB35-C1]WMJ76932.1 helix-turn-helix domain-containing protein [Sedimentibacter sp. MB35-C1]
MKKYLSIGEVSKIKDVSVKSLRYYGKLGILPPIYINEETGYRYYSVEQLVIVDLIMVCLDLGIPLKNFREYLTEDGCVDIGKLFADGEKIVKEKVEKLKNSVAFLDNMSKHIDRTNKVKNYKEEFTQHIPKRYFLTVDWNGDITDYREISGKYSKIFKQCSELCIPDTFNQGVLFLMQEQEIIKKVFVEIPYFIESVENLVIINEGEFLCKVMKDTDLTSILEQEITDTLIIKELFDLKLEPQSGLVEVQKRTLLLDSAIMA